jgi:transposase
MTVKTDRKDARGLAQVIRIGWFRPMHAKSIRSQEVRALLVAHKQLLGRLVDVELSIREILRGFPQNGGMGTKNVREFALDRQQSAMRMRGGHGSKRSLSPVHA